MTSEWENGSSHVRSKASKRRQWEIERKSNETGRYSRNTIKRNHKEKYPNKRHQWHQ